MAEGGLATDLPLVVLVDAGTASSSEIVSGALQDAGRAQIVGVKTYGTGTVLGEFVLSDGSALRVGTVEWLTPKGHQIWHNGITPDVVVERASDVQPHLAGRRPRADRRPRSKSLADPQLAKAIELSRIRLGETPSTRPGPVAAGSSPAVSSGPSSGRLIVSVPPPSAGTGLAGFALSTCSAGGLPVLNIA